MKLLEIYMLMIHALILQHKDTQTIETILNKKFSSLCEWFIDNKLSIRFREGIKKSNQFFLLGVKPQQDHLIKQYNCVKYLGCFLDCNLNGKTTARKVLNKINGKLKFLSRHATFLNPTCKILSTFQCTDSTPLWLWLHIMVPVA